MVSIIMFHLLNNRFTFLELDNNEKNMCWRIQFSAIAHLQNPPFTTSQKMCPIPNIPLIGENIIFFSKKTF